MPYESEGLCEIFSAFCGCFLAFHIQSALSQNSLNIVFPWWSEAVCGRFCGQKRSPFFGRPFLCVLRRHGLTPVAQHRVLQLQAHRQWYRCAWHTASWPEPQLRSGFLGGWGRYQDRPEQPGTSHSILYPGCLRPCDGTDAAGQCRPDGCLHLHDFRGEKGKWRLKTTKEPWNPTVSRLLRWSECHYRTWKSPGISMVCRRQQEVLFMYIINYQLSPLVALSGP